VTLAGAIDLGYDRSKRFLGEDSVRKLLGVVVGAVVAVGVIFALELLDHRLFSWPNVDMRDVAALRTMIEGAPMTAKAMIVGGWFMGALAGGLIAVRLAGWAWAGWIVALLVVAGGVTNVLVIPHPLWMQVAAIAAPLFAGVVVSGASGAA